MLTDAHYIDTRPGQANVFSPPAPVDDYKAWLINQHKNSIDSGDGYPSGVTQKINIIMQQQKTMLKQEQTPKEIMAHGPYAGAAAEALFKISDGELDIKVLS